MFASGSGRQTAPRQAGASLNVVALRRWHSLPSLCDSKCSTAGNAGWNACAIGGGDRRVIIHRQCQIQWNVRLATDSKHSRAISESSLRCRHSSFGDLCATTTLFLRCPTLALAFFPMSRRRSIALFSISVAAAAASRDSSSCRSLDRNNTLASTYTRGWSDGARTICRP